MGSTVVIDANGAVMVYLSTPQDMDITNFKMLSGILGRGGGQVVNVLIFFSNDLSSNPADIYRYLCKICVWKEQK